MSSEEFFLNWIDHHKAVVGVFEKLLDENALVDCTLAAEGQYLRAHKIILSACSPYFEMLFKQVEEKNPIVILKDIKFRELKALIDFIYRGSVQIFQDRLQNFVEAAECLQIKGLGIDHQRNYSETKTTKNHHVDRNCKSPVPHKRLRNSSLGNKGEYASVSQPDIPDNSENITSESHYQHQRTLDIPKASPSSLLSGHTISPINITVPSVNACRTTMTYPTQCVPSEEEELYPNVDKVKIETGLQNCEDADISECELVELKEEMGEEEIVLSDGEDGMAEPMMEEASSEYHQDPNSLSSYESGLKENTTFVVQQFDVDQKDEESANMAMGSIDNVGSESNLGRKFFLVRSHLNGKASMVYEEIEELEYKQLECRFTLLEDMKSVTSKMMSNFRIQWQEVKRTEDTFLKMFGDWLSEFVF